MSARRGVRSTARLLAAALVLALVAAASSRAEPGSIATDPDVRAADLRRHVVRLASEEFGGREATTEGARRAAAYLAAEMERVGLEPGGPDGSYFQTFAIPTPVLGEGNRLVVVTDAGETALAVERDWNPFSLSPSGEASGPLVFAGYGITAPGRSWDDYAGLDVRGKVVLVLRKDPGWNDVRHAAFTAKLANAAKHGAVALLLCNDPATLAGGPDHLLSWRAPAGGSVGGGKVPYVFVTQAAARWLLAPLGRSLEDIETLLRTGGPLSAPVDGVHVQLRTAVGMTRDPNARNVVGLLRGADPAVAGEHVVVGAHFDHLGHGRFGSLAGAGSGATLHPGADDNASGTAGVLELAESFARSASRPRRTLVFVAFTGEERGLYGSRHYVSDPVLPLAGAVAMVNMDMIGRSRDLKLHVGGVGTGAGLQALVAKANESHGLHVSWGQGGGAPSDSLPFFRKRVPSLFVFTGTHDDYHRPTDTADRILYDAQERVVRLVRDVVVRLADAPERMTYTEPPASRRPQTRRHSPLLGVALQRGRSAQRAAVVSVTPDGPASRAGVQAGDVIVAFAGTEVKGRGGLVAVLRKLEAGQPVEIVVLRGDQRLVFEVVPVARGRR